jgi:phosphate/sulfate permease
MSNIFLIIILVLLGLAVLDLVVGVSNDAVNFLNSSIGSKAAPLWVILTVATVGILLGSLFSGGMMEIARSGVFFPSKFTFPEIMMLFLAVMITDVILLDVFNTFGLPTSTTVSLVFELLGSAVAVSLFKIWESDAGASLSEYINAGKSIAIISGIFISIAIAFVCGTVVMYISRVIFSFNYKILFKYFGALWSGLAFVGIAYFVIFKVLLASTLISEETTAFINANIGTFLWVIFLVSTLIMAVLQHLFKVNILVIVVLAGTMSLAMSFAGNDLVNFIGPFMAALNSFQIASDVSAAGGSIDNLYMNALSEPVKADWRYLMGAGIVMILTLWFSKKARTVTKTEVSLARQGEGVERFSSSQASRALVRSAIDFSRLMEKITPSKVKYFFESRFEAVPSHDPNAPSFDLIRASVNLTVSALLISLGTSLKLPLSTTYVTFMVAMGTSLADRAWGRESAVYRITGVLTVIGGWLLTALIAFSVSMLVGFALMYGKIYAVYGLLILVVVLLIQFASVHRRRERKESAKNSPVLNDEEAILLQCTEAVKQTIETTIRIYGGTLEALHTEDRKMIRKLYKEADILNTAWKDKRTYEVLPTLRQLQPGALEIGQYYVQIVDFSHEISKSLRVITEASHTYVENNHEPFSREQLDDLMSISEAFIDVFNEYAKMVEANDYHSYNNIRNKQIKISEMFSELTKKQIKRAKANESGTRNSILFLNILNEAKLISLQINNLMRARFRLFSSVTNKIT